MANPAASLENVDVWPSCTFSVSSEVDSKLMLIPIEKMRELLDYTDEGFELSNGVKGEKGYRCVLTVADGEVVYRD